MYLYQKFGYETTFIKEENEQEILDKMTSVFEQEHPKICGFDTETTGLNIITDKPFLFVFGFNKHIYTFEPRRSVLEVVYGLMEKCQRVFAHNAKYDYHMMRNWGYEIPESVAIADSITVARLTHYADSEHTRLGLESIGVEYVDKEAKFAGHVIKRHLTTINKERKDFVKKNLTLLKGVKFNEVWESYKNRVAYVDDDNELFNQISSIYSEANYEDVYKAYPQLMISYATDDVVIMLEYLATSLPILMEVDPGLVTFKRECELIRVIADMEDVGIKLDIDYVLNCRNDILRYREERYNDLWEMLGEKISVGQHDAIKKLFKTVYGVVLLSADKKALKTITNEQAKDCANLIIELRTLDKWLSTYIDGKLNSAVNGRIHTEINNSGAVSGRVSCNMQQQPKEALFDKDGKELFHPRRAFICDDDCIFVFADFSQMELRFQAYYTILCGEPDINLCRAYMPYKCKSFLTGEHFDFDNMDHLARWDSGEWEQLEDGNPWEEVDLHTLTTFNAFPFLNNDKSHPEFKHYRKLGKMCNFLKNYQGGVGAIMEQLDIPKDIAQNLDDAYYKSFPSIRTYQQWVDRELTEKGFVSNLFGRRYYMESSRNYYKACNYVIQGGCADYVKLLELKVHALLKPYKAKFVLPIHDELMIIVPKDELFLVNMIKATMEDKDHIIRNVPMICDVEYADKNWAEKYDWSGELNG